MVGRRQGNTDKTIQGKLEQILLKMTEKKSKSMVPASTDAESTQKAKVANFHIDWKELEKNGKKRKKWERMYQT